MEFCQMMFFYHMTGYLDKCIFMVEFNIYTTFVRFTDYNNRSIMLYRLIYQCIRYGLITQHFFVHNNDIDDIKIHILINRSLGASFVGIHTNRRTGIIYKNTIPCR